LLLLCGQLTACPTHNEFAPGSAAVTDAGQPDRPSRTVVQDQPDGAFQGDADLPTIGANQVVRDAGPRTLGDVKVSWDGTSGSGDGAAAGCNVVKQNCGANKGCYPTPDTGGVKCLPAGDLSQGVACSDHTQCGPGLICVEASDAGSLCLHACDKLSGTGCLSGDTCHGYDGNVGYCAP
jgi:hypothetical protein